MTGAAVLAISALFLAPPRVALAAVVLTVDSLSDDRGDCRRQGECTLRAAVEQADSSGGTTVINVPPGNYTPSDALLLGLRDADISIVGLGTSPSEVVIARFASSFGVFEFGAYTTAGKTILRLSNLTLTSHWTGGPAIVNRTGGAGDAYVDNVVFLGCGSSSRTDGNGGAIEWSGHGLLQITNSTFSENHATRHGGAIFAGLGAEVIVFDTTFSDNGAGLGGGAIAAGDPTNEWAGTGGVTASGVVFDGNHVDAADGKGGAVLLAGGRLDAIASAFTGNRAPLGGAIFAQDSATVYLLRNRIVNNGPSAAIGIAPHRSGDYPGGVYQGSNNWWGCNGGPNAPGCDGVDERYVESPPAVFAVSVPASPVVAGTPVTVTASVRFARVAGTQVTWSTTAGSLSAPTSPMGSDGRATVTFTAADCATTTATITARYDNAVVETPIVVACPNASTTPPPLGGAAPTAGPSVTAPPTSSLANAPGSGGGSGWLALFAAAAAFACSVLAFRRGRARRPPNRRPGGP